MLQCYITPIDYSENIRKEFKPISPTIITQSLTPANVVIDSIKKNKTLTLDDWNELISLFFSDNKVELNDSLNLFQKKIDNDEMPKTHELLQDYKARIPNAFFIYFRQLKKCGLDNIISKFCGRNGIYRQSKLSLKIATNLWEKSPEHQRFFSELASEARKEHEKMYPKHKPRTSIIRKEFTYSVESETKTIDSFSSTIDSFSYLDNPQDFSIYSSTPDMMSSILQLPLPLFLENNEFTSSDPLFIPNYYIFDEPDIPNIKISNLTFWSDALETRLCELYMKDDVVDIFWGQPIEEHLNSSTDWHVYVITRGLHNSYAKTEIITDKQVIRFITEEERFVSFDDPLPSSLNIPQDLRENFNEALDNELGLSFREAHYNLVGIGTGYKQIRGQFTEIPAIIFYIRQKGILRRGCDGLLPKMIRGYPTDVIECVAIPCAGSGVDTCRRYQENVKLGSSIGIGLEKNNTTGTLSAVAYENSPPYRIGIISCEHVLKFNDSNSKKNITIFQPSYNDLFEPKKKLEELHELSRESEYEEDDEYTDEINEMLRKLNLAESRNSTLATYVKGMRENFRSKMDNKNYGIDAGFCVFDNENRKLSSKNFPIPSNNFINAGLSTCLEGTYTYHELRNFDYNNNKIFKVGRTTGLTLGKLLPTDQAIAYSLTNESIKNAKKLTMEKHIPCYSNADQEIFIGYMKSQLDSEICQKRKKCYPIKWFDRQLAFQFEPGEFECGDSGASILDKQGKALGILHAKLRIPNQTFGIASPYFAILEALDVSICLSSKPVKPTIISPPIISPPPSYLSLPFSNTNDDCERTPPPAYLFSNNKSDCESETPPPLYLSSNVQNYYSRVIKRDMDIKVEINKNPKRTRIGQEDF
ncbi:hypothetical protein RclHR1_02830010 [Rhizophagus clarus]|uniref:Uncharacterized protein n=1 Tax=Rhizophagus clarus TaxID=94130 RepID=A0A2Z6RFH7_9GLOM|nr:hypothetical protein RclHR1_02830010 [Rhizophagus clarus]